MYTPKQRQDIYSEILCDIAPERLDGICFELIKYCTHIPDHDVLCHYGMGENCLGLGTFPEFDLFFPDLKVEGNRFNDEDRIFALQLCLEMTKN